MTQQQRRGAGQQGGQEQQQNQLPDQQTIKKIIDGDTRLLVSTAEDLGRILVGNSLTTSQIRNVYGMVKRMEMTGYEANKDELLLLKPKLAYAAARPGAKKGTKDLKQVLSHAIDSVTGQAQFEQFINFFEAILAYHRAAGGK